MDDYQMKMNMGPQPNYYNNNLQNNPLNGPYQPEPIFIPPPPPAMQPNPLNTGTNKPTMVYQIVSNSGYPPCPFCLRSVPTIARRVTSQAQIFWCFILFLFVPFICCIPFCMSSCDDIHYECSNCRRVVSMTIRPIC